MATFLQLYGERLTRELGSADGDPAQGAGELFTTTRRKAAINEAQLEFAKLTGCFTRDALITIAAGTQEYDLDATGIISAGDYLDVAAQGPTHEYTDTGGTVTYTAGKDFPRIDIPVLDEDAPGWRNSDSTSELPTSWYLREAEGSVYFGLVPIPELGSGDSALVRLPYSAVPPDMTDDAHEPFSVVMGTSPKRTLRPWHQALVHFAAAILEPLRKNYEGEQRQRSLFAAQVADYLQQRRPKGDSQVRLAQNYYATARSRGMLQQGLDPRRWP